MNERNKERQTSINKKRKHGNKHRTKGIKKERNHDRKTDRKKHMIKKERKNAITNDRETELNT